MSVSERDRSIITHIASYCDQIYEAVDRFGNDFEVFEKDRIFRNSVSMCILQIGELVTILSDEFKDQYESVPWRQIKQMRNIVAHRYGTVDNSITWDVIQNDIPALKEFCETII